MQSHGVGHTADPMSLILVTTGRVAASCVKIAEHESHRGMMRVMGVRLNEWVQGDGTKRLTQQTRLEARSSFNPTKSARAVSSVRCSGTVGRRTKNLNFCTGVDM